MSASKPSRSPVHMSGTTLDASVFHPEEHWRVARTCGASRCWHPVEHDGEDFWLLESGWGQAHIVGLVVPAVGFTVSMRLDFSCARRGALSLVLCESMRMGRASLKGGGDNGEPFQIDAWAAVNISLEDGVALSGPSVGAETRWPVPVGAFAAPTTVELRRHDGKLEVLLGGVALGSCPERRPPSAAMLVLIGGHSQDDPPALCFGAIRVTRCSLESSKASVEEDGPD